MAHVFLGLPASSPTLLQNVIVAVTLAVFALFLPILLVARAARVASKKGHLLEQEHVSKKLSLQPPAGADVKTAKRKKRKMRKHGQKSVGRHGVQDGTADGSHQGQSDSDGAGAALEAAWSGSEAADATLKIHLCVGSLGVAGSQSMVAPLLAASVSQAELQQAETNELPAVAEHQQSNKLHAEAEDCWQSIVCPSGVRQQLAMEIEQKTQTTLVSSCPPDLPLLQEAEPQCEPEQTAEYGAEWGCITERRYGRMVFLLHREIRAETLRRCPPGLGPLLGSTGAVTQESTPLKGLSTRRLTLRHNAQPLNLL